MIDDNIVVLPYSAFDSSKSPLQLGLSIKTEGRLKRSRDQGCFESNSDREDGDGTLLVIWTV
jgi:hypothetical protein